MNWWTLTSCVHLFVKSVTIEVFGIHVTVLSYFEGITIIAVAVCGELQLITTKDGLLWHGGTSS